MAPRKLIFKSSKSSRSKENAFLRGLSDFQARIRRRESLRNTTTLKEERKRHWLWLFTRMNSCFPPLSLNEEPTPSPADKLQVLHDLDLYYIKQMAHSLQEVELEQKIEVEMKMREGTTKLLAACKHQSQSLEAAKSLLTSNQRMSAYLAELQNRKRHHYPKSTGCRGRVCLSDLRIPLIWRDTDHFKNKGDYRRFAVFCLIRIGSQLYDTTLLTPIDRCLTDLTFPDVIVFNDVQSDFCLTLDVYSHILRDDLSIASTRSKIKNTIHNSISRTVGKKLAASLREELDDTKIGPSFDLIASARLSLDDVCDAIRTHDLSIQVPETARRFGEGLPLFGHFCCRLAAEPDLSRKESISSLTAGGSWATLHGFELFLWRPPSTRHNPHAVVPVNKDTTIKKVNGKSEVIIVNEKEGSEESTRLTFESQEQCDVWISHLTNHVRDHKRWKNAACNKMQIYSPGNGKNNFRRSSQQGSLYDQTPIIDLKGEKGKVRSSPKTGSCSSSRTSCLEEMFRTTNR